MHKYIQDVAYFIKCSSIWVKSSILVHYMLQMLHKYCGTHTFEEMSE